MVMKAGIYGVKCHRTSYWLAAVLEGYQNILEYLWYIWNNTTYFNIISQIMILSTLVLSFYIDIVSMLSTTNGLMQDSSNSIAIALELLN